MKKSSKALVLATTALSPLTFAAGFQISEHSVSGLGRAYAGEAAMVDNAAVIARNPAAMSYFDKQSVSIVGHYIDPSVDVEGSNSGAADASADDIAPSAFVPGAFYVLPIDEKLAFGVALTSHFGLSSDYPSSYGGAEFAQDASLKAIYITPQVSYKFNDAFSVGFGVSYISGEGELSNSFSGVAAQGFNNSPLGGLYTATPGDTVLDLEADGDGFGWNVGAMWQINENSRLGFRYMAAVDLDTDAEYRVFSAEAIQQTNGMVAYADLKGTLTFNLPDVAELSYTQKVSDQWDVSASLMHTGWSSFEELAVDGTQLKEEDWEDAMRYSIGADYKVNDDISIRFGYAFDESPVKDEKRTLSIPDADRNWFSVGATFGLEVGSIDAAFTYVQGDSVDVNEPSTLGTTFVGELTKTDAFIYAVGYNIAF